MSSFTFIIERIMAANYTFKDSAFIKLDSCNKYFLDV